MLKILFALAIILTIWQMSPVRDSKTAGPSETRQGVLQAAMPALGPHAVALGLTGIPQDWPPNRTDEAKRQDGSPHR